MYSCLWCSCVQPDLCECTTGAYLTGVYEHVLLCLSSQTDCVAHGNSPGSVHELCKAAGAQVQLKGNGFSLLEIPPKTDTVINLLPEPSFS